jgi:hypothetical protein
MGGASSEIGPSTRDVVVESAIFDPISIRQTAFRYALRSEASLRFEKGQEHGLARLGADRTARLITEWAGGQVARGVVDTDPRLSQAYFEADAETPTDELPAAARRVRAMTTAKNLALLIVDTDAPPTSETARALVRTIRADRQVGDGTFIVGGAPANDVDLNAFILARVPRALAFILIVTYVVLFAMLRSVILPIKAVIMNLLSIAASFGALVWVFQEGHLADVLRFEPLSFFVQIRFHVSLRWQQYRPIVDYERLHGIIQPHCCAHWPDVNSIYKTTSYASLLALHEAILAGVYDATNWDVRHPIGLLPLRLVRG